MVRRFTEEYQVKVYRSGGKNRKPRAKLVTKYRRYSRWVPLGE